MEPQIIDFYNDFPHSVNVIEKMNEELTKIQKENDILKKKLEEQQLPIVIYKDEEELERVKEEAYNEFNNGLCKVSLEHPGIFPHLMYLIEILLNKLLKDKKDKSNWSYNTSGELYTLIDNIIEPLSEKGFFII